MAVHPLTGKPKNGKPRAEVLESFARNRRPVRATYDAARDTTDFENYWSHTDTLDADSANARAVREKLVPRSRYEVGNNGYADGITQTYATDLVGVGPTLRMQSGSQGFNQMVEFQWKLWASAVQLRRKLWCQAHAKHMDGEGFGIARTNPGIKHRVQLDYVLYETEQVQTPLLPFNQVGYIDGIRFDEWGNPLWFDVLTNHPSAVGGANDFNVNDLSERMSRSASSTFDLVPERVLAEFVMHWFLLRRPGQHRGVPESTSTLQVGASSRRWREATIAAAETAADFSVMLKTQMSPDEADAVSPLSTVDIEKRMMTALPMGWEASQMRAEHPNSTFEAFNKAQINEQARPRSMPYNKAACDSSEYNYASGRLDHQTYYGSLDVDRADGNDLVLSPLFNVWFDEAVREFGWLGGNPNAINPAARNHGWDWPKHRVADIVSEAKANETKLRTGQTTLSKLYSEAGEDFEDELIVMARDYGVEPDEMRKTLLVAIFNQGNALGSMQQTEQTPAPVTEPDSEETDADEE